MGKRDKTKTDELSEDDTQSLFCSRNKQTSEHKVSSLLHTHSAVSEQEDPQEVNWEYNDAAQDTNHKTLKSDVQYSQYFKNLSRGSHVSKFIPHKKAKLKTI